MAKYFLGSVGKAEAFRVVDDKLTLAFVSNTLTDSGINIQTTKEDIRAGQGAPIQFSFYHDPSVEITLTDVLWKKDYLTAQLGAQFNEEDEAYVTEKVTFENGVASNFTKTVVALPYACSDTDQYAVWGTKVGLDDWKDIEYDKTAQKLTLTGDYAGQSGDFCIRYLSGDKKAQIAKINTQIIPEELFLIITAPIFAGDSCNASKGKAAGSITFEIPRFQLNGAQEFQMNMSSNQTMSLSGIALASPSKDCECSLAGDELLRVMEVICDYDYRDEIVDLIADLEDAKVGEEPVFYGIKKDGKPTKVYVTDLTFPEGYVADGVYTQDAATNSPFTVSLKNAKGEVVADDTEVYVGTGE